MFNTIKVNYKHTTRPYVANSFLSEIKKYPIIACDLETAIKYTEEELELCRTIVDDLDVPKMDRIKAKGMLKATALDHPSHCTVTHCSIAISESEAYVFILDNDRIRDLVFNFLVTTEQIQVWHNASFDFKYTYYLTGKFPINYEDTQLLSKTLVNHVDTWKAKTGLKELAGSWYGNWGIDSTLFTKAEMYTEKMLSYSAIDSTAAWKLYEFITEQCDEIDKETKEEYRIASLMEEPLWMD